ncbi:MAG: EamA family transporter [Halobacteriovoraceae bacterium]|nr:EamA family transporter [Halobacteriovoraceae bacterium]
MIGFLLIVAACAFWALDTLIRYPLSHLLQNSFVIVFYEHMFLSLLLLAISFKSLRRFKNIKLNHFMSFFIVGGIGSALATLAFTKAFSFLNPSLVIILQKFQPLFAIMMASYILNEKIQKEFIGWAIVCLVGAFLISYQDIVLVVREFTNIKQLIFHERSFQGYMLVLFSVLGWAAATVYGKKLVNLGYGDDLILTGRFLTGFLCLLPFAFFETTLFTHDVDIYAKISLMVLVSGLLAMYLYYQGLRRIPARLCTLAEMFFPLMAVIVNWIFLGASLSIVQISGAIILVAGSLIIQIKQY